MNLAGCAHMLSICINYDLCAVALLKAEWRNLNQPETISFAAVLSLLFNFFLAKIEVGGGSLQKKS